MIPRGRSGVARNDFSAAAKLFEQAYRLSPDERFLWNEAISELSAGEAVAAYGHLKMCRQAPQLSAEERERIDAALADARTRVQLLIIKAPDGALVTIDEVTVGTAPLADAVPVDPTRAHAVSATLHDAEVSRDVEPRAGSVEVVLVPPEPPPLPPAPLAILPIGAVREKPRIDPARAATAGSLVLAGLAAGAIAIYFDAQSVSEANDASRLRGEVSRSANAPPGSACYMVASAASAQLAADNQASPDNFWRAVYVGVGAVALVGGGVAAWFLWPSHRRLRTLRRPSRGTGPFGSAEPIGWLSRPAHVPRGYGRRPRGVLIPAFPLDGGRVLRSVLWAIGGDLRTSTRRVSAIGQMFGWLLIVAGIAMTFGAHIVFFGSGFAGGLWLAFIGWFLHSAAARSYTRLAIDDALAGHTGEEIMRRDVTAEPPALSLSSLVHDYLVRSDERALPVVGEGEFLGLVAMADLRRIPSLDWPATPVGSVMSPRTSLAVITPNTPLGEAFAKFAQDDIEQLPVLEGGRLVGMLQRRDIARWLELAPRPIESQRSRSVPAHESRTPPRGALSAPPRGNDPRARPT